MSEQAVTMQCHIPFPEGEPRAAKLENSGQSQTTGDKTCTLTC